MTRLEEASCGACRGAWGGCQCALAVPVESTQLMQFALGFALVGRSGTPPSKERAHYVAQLLGFETQRGEAGL